MTVAALGETIAPLDWIGVSEPNHAISCSALAGDAAGNSLAATTGSISGTVKDPSGAVIPGATVTATDTATNVQSKTVSDDKGFYAFPSLPVGRYNVKAEEGFGTQARNNLQVDANGALVVDLTIEMAEKVEEVTVLENAAQVETASSQMGQVVTGTQMTSVALNGRSYTDLLALQPGIVPMSTQQPDSIVMAGASVAIAPSGGLNPGNQSISGQREDANGFMVNGGDVKELMNGGTTIVPDLDSIAEFRVLTNNVDAEYGNYSGGIVNVVTKGGGNQIHGRAFEFLRNTDLDARNFFSPDRSFYRQNQFGGTVGGPIKKDKIFYFGDYQGTRTAQGIDTGLIPVPTLAERSGNSATLTGSERPVSGESASEKLGYPVRRTSRTTRFFQAEYPATGLVRAGAAPAAIHSSSQYRTIDLFDWRGGQDRARRQRQLQSGRQQRALGTVVRLLFLRRLHFEQSLPDWTRRRQRSRL